MEISELLQSAINILIILFEEMAFNKYLYILLFKCQNILHIHVSIQHNKIHNAPCC